MSTCMHACVHVCVCTHPGRRVFVRMCTRTYGRAVVEPHWFWEGRQSWALLTDPHPLYFPA